MGEQQRPGGEFQIAFGTTLGDAEIRWNGCHVGFIPNDAGRALAAVLAAAPPAPSPEQSQRDDTMRHRWEATDDEWVRVTIGLTRDEWQALSDDAGYNGDGHHDGRVWSLVKDRALTPAALPVRERGQDEEALRLLYRIRDYWDGNVIPDRYRDTQEGLLAAIHDLIDPDPAQAWSDAPAAPGTGEPT